MSTRKIQPKPSKPAQTAESMTAQTTGAVDVSDAGRAIVASIDARETGARSIIESVRAARARFVDSKESVSDRSLSAAIHTAAIAIRAEALAMPSDSAAVTRGVTLGSVRAYVSADSLLSGANVPATAETATAAYRAVVSGATVTVRDMIANARGFAESDDDTRAERFAEIVREAVRLPKPKPASKPAEPETPETGGPSDESDETAGGDYSGETAETGAEPSAILSRLQSALKGAAALVREHPEHAEAARLMMVEALDVIETASLKHDRALTAA